MSDAIYINTLSDDEFDFLLREYWEQIALFAYQGYVKNGRGAVCIERDVEKADFLADQVSLMYAVYPNQAPDIRASEMIASYDPQLEIILQYL